MTFYCIDFESTGASNGQEPLEFAWVEIDKSGDIGKHREIGLVQKAKVITDKQN